MRWDAFARTPKGRKIRSKKVLESFKCGSKLVREATGNVDDYLEEASLGCFDTKEALAKATGTMVRQRNDSWSVAEVKAVYEQANWNRAEGDLAMIVSTRMFLKLCYIHKLSVEFSVIP